MAKPDWRCGAARGLPIDRDRAWDGPGAASRMLDAAGIGGKNPRPEQAKRGFLLYDAANADLRGSYKLPFADLVDGKLTAFASGIRAAASRLPQTDAPARERDRARQILDDYERRMGDEPKDGDKPKDGADAARATAGRRPHALPHLAQRLLNTPLALHPAKGEVIVAALADRLGVTQLLRADGTMRAFYLDDDDDEQPPPAPLTPYDVHAGVAVIPVHGTLVHRLGAVRPVSGMTGYDGIRAAFDAALSDDAVRGIAFDIDSPGGEVNGCFGLADHIFANRARKPSIAIVDEGAYSAAYAIASAAGRIVVPRTGGVGSIGVIAMIADISRALERGGVTVNIIQFGARKADGVEAIPLAPEARARFQADVDAMGTLFCETVARNRALLASDVQAQEAGTYLGADSVRAGLADRVAEPQQAFADFVTTLQGDH